MSLFECLGWGVLAGTVIVLVKILGPDQPYVQSLFNGAARPDITFYMFISLITIVLGCLSGAFCNESERIKLLLFCASVPALLATATSERRNPVLDKPATGTVCRRALSQSPFCPSPHQRRPSR